MNPTKMTFRLLSAFLTVALAACSSPNPSAPVSTQVHPTGFIVDHANEAAVAPASCQACHGSDWQGSAHVTGCFSCHDSGPPFSIHALPYANPAVHGTAARNGQKSCLSCHGTAPNRFDGGLVSDSLRLNKSEGNCSATACHPAAGAHPVNWQGTNDTNGNGYSSSHRNVTQAAINTSCVLCHQVTAGGPHPMAASPSCFNASFTNADGSTTGCHPGGPGTAAHVLPYAAAALHGPSAKANLAACQACHGTVGTTAFDGGPTGVGCDTTGCHDAAGAHPVNWQGTNDTNGLGYASSHRNAGYQTTACAICHDVTQGRSAPNTASPSCFSASFTNADGSTTGCHAGGPSAAHVLPFADPAQHGTEAKANLSACVACHAVPADAGPGDNPRFNLAVGSMANGCEDCHDAFTAHPTGLWTGAAATSHATAGQMDTACALCHGAQLAGPSQGGVGTACADCHTAGSPLTLASCTSCHNVAPDDGAPAGSGYPNRQGSHGVHTALTGVGGNCAVCHNGVGAGTDGHYDTSAPADVVLLAGYNAKSGAATYNAGGQRCGTTRCHGGQSSPSWLTGQIDVASDCAACHQQGTAQYNGYHSGKHKKHVQDEHLACTQCHSPSRLASGHFVNLATTAFEADPADSLLNSLAYNKSTRNGCSVGGCHGQKTWN